MRAAWLPPGRLVEHQQKKKINGNETHEPSVHAKSRASKKQVVLSTQQGRHGRLKKKNARLIRNRETMRTKNKQTNKQPHEEINRKESQTKKEVSTHTRMLTKEQNKNKPETR